MWQNIDGYRDFLRDLLSQEDLDPKWIQWNEQACAIIDTMIDDERQWVFAAFPESNIERIARDSGVPAASVAAFLTWYRSQIPGFNFHRRPDRRKLFRKLFPCTRSHTKLLAGTCPWCGKSILFGKIAS